MRMEQLRCLVDIAQTGSLTSTAQRLFVSQQAISKSMKQLEKELDIEILVRTNMGVRITPEGQKVVEFARIVLAEEEKLHQDLRNLPRTVREQMLQVKICSASAVTNIVLPNVINQMEREHQKVGFEISMVDSLDEILEKVSSGEKDLGLITFNAEELIRRFAEFEQDIQLDILARDEMVAAIHKRYLKFDEPMNLGKEIEKRSMTLYNIIPVNAGYRDPRGTYMMYSNDADFHRMMMEKNGAIVLMPSLAYHYFFSPKTIMLFDISDNIGVPLIHAAIYHKDAPEHIQSLAAMIRKAMQMK